MPPLILTSIFSADPVTDLMSAEDLHGSNTSLRTAHLFSVLKVARLIISARQTIATVRKRQDDVAASLVCKPDEGLRFIRSRPMSFHQGIF